MTDKIFDPITKFETVIYNSNGDEIDRLQGKADIHPKDYDQHLPIEYRVIETTTRIISITKVEKAEKPK